MLSLAAEEEFELSTGAQCLIRPNAGSGRVGVVSLHPWGPLGGSLDDPHVRAVTQFFGKGGCATCRVQFRSGFGRGEASVDEEWIEDAADVDDINHTLSRQKLAENLNDRRLLKKKSPHK